jgi:hypothetical protein
MGGGCGDGSETAIGGNDARKSFHSIFYFNIVENQYMPPYTPIRPSMVRQGRLLADTLFPWLLGYASTSLALSLLPDS